MATDNAVGVQGGNFKIFENFVNRSGAKLFLNTTVSLRAPSFSTHLRCFQVRSILPKSESSHNWTVRSSRGSVDYQAVVLAAPFHSSGITLPPSLSSQILKQPYIHLHVTLLTTTSSTPNSTYFSLPSTSRAPRMILTTYEGVRKGGREPEFNSLSYHGLVREGEWAVKIFSQQRISDEWLQNVFNGQVGWVYRKEVYFYPSSVFSFMKVFFFDI